MSKTPWIAGVSKRALRVYAKEVPNQGLRPRTRCARVVAVSLQFHLTLTMRGVRPPNSNDARRAASEASPA